jgi:ABC-type multidrug transport system fused ATPase/permease subunit
MEEDQNRRFDESSQALMNWQLRSGRISALLNPVTFVLVNLAVVMLIHVGALRVDSGILSQGMVIALYNYMTQILVELIKMANLIITMTKAVACGNRISDLLEIPCEDRSGDSPEKLEGAVSFENVSARYEGAAEPSLENITFRALPGQTVGVIGGTGSGKSTLIGLIPGFYACENGSVSIDGRDVSELDDRFLRENIGIVPQKAVLFKGTIRDNLLWGREGAMDEELWTALEIAQAKDVVLSKEGGLDALVEQGGANFSGGQKQRLTIARALVRKPAILILDDSASALDYATDAKLRMAIRNMEHAPTTFIVSQRAASVRYADMILVLDDGRLVASGTHEELLESCEVYQEIFYSQFPKEVAANG